MNYDLRIHPSLNVGQTLQKLQEAYVKRGAKRGGASASAVPHVAAKPTGNHSLIRGNRGALLLHGLGLPVVESARESFFAGDLHA